LKLCTSLVTLSDVGSDAGGALKKGWGRYRKFPQDVKILQFSHFLVKEFILSERAQRQLPKNLSINFASSHVRIVQMCLIYLIDFNGGRRARELNHDEYPLLTYFALHWTQHWNTVTLEDKHCVEELLLRLFDTERSDGLRNYLNLYNPTPPNNLERSPWSGVIAHRAQNRRGLQMGSALYYACYLGLETIASWILDSNLGTLERDDLANSLGLAAIGGYNTIVELLLRKQADPDGFKAVFNFDLLSVVIASSLQAAAYKGDALSAKLLIKAGADVNKIPSESGTALHIAALRGHVEVIVVLLDHSADIDSWVSRRGLVLTAAAEDGNEPAVLLLVQRGVDPNRNGGGSYDSSLEAACDKCSVAVVRALLEAGAKPEGSRALYVAAERGDVEIMRLLIENGAELNGLVGIYGSPLQASIQSREIDAFELLITSGADFQVEGGCNGSALGQAVFSYNLPVVDRLLELEARIEDTALIEAINMDLTQVAKLLLDRGADPDAQTGDSYKEYGNALQFAICKDLDDIVDMLLQNGADVSAIGGEQGSAVQAATLNGKESIARKTSGTWSQNRLAPVRQVRYSTTSRSPGPRLSNCEVASRSRCRC
jgi:ankyrin repeat protein